MSILSDKIKYMPNYKQIEKVLDLASKTGDKVIVLSDTHDPYVVMSVKDYEALLHGPSSVKGLSEDELLDKINRDIAIWKASQDNLADYSLEDFRVETLRKDSKDKEKPVTTTTENIIDTPDFEEANKYYVEPID